MTGAGSRLISKFGGSVIARGLATFSGGGAVEGRGGVGVAGIMIEAGLGNGSWTSGGISLGLGSLTGGSGGRRSSKSGDGEAR